MTDNNFDADAAAGTIIDNELNLDDPKMDGHPDDVREAFRAVAAEITQGMGPGPNKEHLASETDDYWLMLYGPGQTSTIADVIREALPDQRGNYRDSLSDEYVHILRQLVTRMMKRRSPGASKRVPTSGSQSLTVNWTFMSPGSPRRTTNE